MSSIRFLPSAQRTLAELQAKKNAPSDKPTLEVLEHPLAPKRVPSAVEISRGGHALIDALRQPIESDEFVQAAPGDRLDCVVEWRP